MQTNKKAFTLVEMIVAMAVSTIIIAGAYASYDMVKTQYTKNLDLSQMQQSGRAIMQMIERDARMAGFEYLDEDANMTYGKISSPLTIKDSGNKCCDELTVIYDYVDDVLDWKGRLVSSSVNRIRVRYWTEAFTSKKGDRFRLYKQKDILGKSNVLLTKPIIGNKEVMADFIEDLQFINITTSGLLYGAGRGDDKIYIWDPTKPKDQEKVGTIDTNLYYQTALAFKTSRTGQESLLTINLTLRAKEKYGKIRQYLKKDYTEGNFAIDKTDNYKRDTFSSKVLVRNMML